ncbi:adenosine deaminase-like protein [Leptomonas pyrrhocoris]|uniref:tRNA-specific adenosine deaminase 1 n=1 Tax=Leptomonas pyrrhocoris TaxID=157538 RepID=A0A0M9FVJ4_LEPPY|nr:adenosine deaminase-like protein [Leptomonas pyrrhocoris]KPA76839.1 adenosine deaminase-like protein [Leptomonas pyrrhocoris]|eukprot:XP_015655278.1 adenosine deaminase-like protein [Leptomonas pyrrhocoris]
MAATFCGAAVDLWGDTPPDAFLRAIQAQRQPIWRALWAQCLDQQERVKPLSGERKEGHDRPLQGGLAKADAAVIVAGFVLSVTRSTVTAAAIAAEANTVDSPSETNAHPLPLSRGARRYLCVSLGSGSRCLGVRDAASNTAEEELQRAFELRDGHAEVMARRGLLAFLIELAECGVRASNQEEAIHVPFLQRVIVPAETSNTSTLTANRCGWALQDDVEVHLVCSRWMCGSLAAVAGGAGRSGHLLLRAGCRCWANKSAERTAEQEEEVQGHVCAGGHAAAPSPILHVQKHVVAAHCSPLDDAGKYAKCARVKPGRGRPNLTMSCTDKVWRWSVLGLQGRRRATLFPKPMRLSSVHVLRSPNAPPASMAESVAGAAARARELFQWRTRSWWPALDAAELARVTPTFSFFFAPSRTGAAAPSVSSSPPLVGNEREDSSYSRSRWLTVHHPPAASSPTQLRKREREESAGVDGAGRCAALRCDWHVEHTSASHNSLVLNTKAGLPQGMTARALQRRGGLPTKNSNAAAAETETRASVSATTESMWRHCPLSRPWMAHHVERASAAANSAAATASCTLPSSSSFLDSMTLLPMGQLAHQHHVRPEQAGNDNTLFLWTTTEGNAEEETEAVENTRRSCMSDVEDSASAL